MPKPARPYTRLTRPTSSVGSYQSLWLAADHLLAVKSSGYHEDYRRILLRDIQGFFAIPSDRRGYWNLPWIVLGLFSGVIAVHTVHVGGRPFVSGIVLALALVFFIWNYLLGEGCRVFVVTRVQTTPLPSLVRRPKARRILARLQPLIEAAQAEMAVAPEEPPALPPSVA